MAGTFSVAPVVEAWTEESVNGKALPALGEAFIAGIPVAREDSGSFVTLDVTALVRQWIDGTTMNHGLALVPDDGRTFFFIDSKENKKTGHEPRIEVMFTWGVAGTVGPKGAPGTPGTAGPPGPAGPEGAPGALGPRGTTGPQGSTGIPGASGATGAQGPRGSTGPAGLAGAQGARGSTGPLGAQGADGASGPMGPIGPQGAPGVQGTTGPAGAIGSVGPQGADGDAGPIGPQGVAGPLGPVGPMGPAGTPGSAGPIGPAGPTGPPGTPPPDSVSGPTLATDHGIARFDGVTGKLILDSGITIDDFDNISGLGTMAVQGAPEPGWAMTIRSTATENGLFIKASDNSGTSPLHIEDVDGTVQFLHVDENLGELGLGTQTPLYGVDNQRRPGVPAADYNTENGVYRIAGQPLAVNHLADADTSTTPPTAGDRLVWDGAAWTPAPAVKRADMGPFRFDRDELTDTLTADWFLASGAWPDFDSANNSLPVHRFDDAAQEGVGWMLHVPAGATTVTVRHVGRPETPPALPDQAVDWILAWREVPTGAPIGAWDSHAGTAFTIPLTSDYQQNAFTLDLVTEGITPGSLHQFEFVREADSGADDLPGDWNLLGLEVEFD